MPKLPGLSDVLHLLEAQTQALLSVPDAVREVVELARDAHRVVRRVDALLDELEPGLQRLGRTLAGDELSTLLAEIDDTHKQVAAIAATTGRIMGVIDDVGTRIGSFPGAPLLAGRRRKPETQD
jgi:hypothetical protein